jgi:GntP family gluconate:H+ symporter
MKHVRLPSALQDLNRPTVELSSRVLFVALLGVVMVVAAITWLRVPAFVALTIGSFFVGLASGMPLAEIPRAFQQGVGDTLGFVAIVIGLGTVIGKLLAESGGALVVAESMTRALGRRRLDWSLLLSAFLIGLPVFFQVGFVLLAPVLFTLVRETGTPLLRLGIPMAAGLSVAHGLVPPHPGPLAAIERLGADTGVTMFYSIALGLPIAAIAGPVFGRFISRRMIVSPGAMAQQLSAAGRNRSAGIGMTLATILLPVALMLAAAAAQMTAADGTMRRAFEFLGNPLVAMLGATLVSMYTFGHACGFDRRRLLEFAEASLPAIASVLLVVGAGGGFGRVLNAAGAGTAIAGAMQGFQVAPLLLGWMIAALLRLAVGSATVACVTAAGIVAPMLGAMPHINRELMVIAIGAGSLIASHVNDGGFWLVKEYYNTSVTQTMATWTLMETIISVLGLAGVLMLAALVG